MYTFNLDFHVTGLELGKTRLLSAHLPFLSASISERDKMAYLSSCISFDSPLMVSQLANPTYQLVKCQVYSIYLIVCVCVCVFVCGFWVAEQS